MDTTLRYKLFGIGKLPDDIRAAIESEGALHIYDGVPAHFAFSGRVPGLVVAGTNTRTYSGAIALSRRRVVGTLSVLPKLAGKVLDVSWEVPSKGPAEVTIDAHGLTVAIDIGRVDPEWKGHLSLHYDLKLSPEELAEIPRRAFAFEVPHEYVLKLVGVPA